MQTLFKFKEFVDEINSSNSRIFKQGVLEKWKEDVIILTYLQFAFNPYIIFGISTEKLSKPVGSMHGITGINSVFTLLEYLKVYNTGSDRVISLCQEFISNVSASDERAADLLEKLICKDLSIGCDAKTINAVIPGLITAFNI